MNFSPLIILKNAGVTEWISFYNNPGSEYSSRVVDEHLSEQLQMPVSGSAKNHKTMQTFDIIFTDMEGENEPCHLYFPLLPPLIHVIIFP